MKNKIQFIRLFGFSLILITLLFGSLILSQGFTELSVHLSKNEDNIISSSVIFFSKDDSDPSDLSTDSSEIKNIELPFSGFIQNLGQLNDDSIGYYYIKETLGVNFGSSAITFLCSSSEGRDSTRWSISFPGSHNVAPIGWSQKTHYVNYFYDGIQLTNVPTYKEIWYKNLYSGIDLRYYMSAQGLKYDFVVHPGADPNQISIQVSDSMALSLEDQVVSMQPISKSKSVYLKDSALQVFQGDKTPILSRFISKGVNTYGFQISPFNPTQVLFIDPLLLSFSTYLGGSDMDAGLRIALDSGGDIYVTGSASSGFPTKNAYNSTNTGIVDVFIAKFNATNNDLIFSTYLGGSEIDAAYGLAIDRDGNSYVTGWTRSADFPVTLNAYDSALSGTDDAFVAKLNATGNGLIFSTYLGGDGYEMGSGIVVDTAGESYIAGRTGSRGFPTLNAYQTFFAGGGEDVFVTKLNSTGNGLVFSTYIGGSNTDKGADIVIDTAGNSFITGYTKSSDFPTVSAYQASWGGDWDIFVTKLNAAGNNLAFSTFLGGSDIDLGNGISVDTAGNSYITGQTRSNNFPVANPYDDSLNGGDDVIIAKFNPTGTSLIFSTYLGGSDHDLGTRLAIDVENFIYITGRTFSSDFPVTSNAHQNTHGGGVSDGFVTILETSGSNLDFSTFIGGNESEDAMGIAVDAHGNSYITGSTKSSDFPVTSSAYQSTIGGWDDVYVTVFVFDEVAPLISLVTPANNSIHTTSVTIDLSITDDNSGISDVYYNWNNTANGTLSSPYDIPLPSSLGLHVLRVYAKDNAGNWSSRKYAFTRQAVITIPTDFLTIEVVVVSLGSVGLVFWLKRKKNFV